MQTAFLEAVVNRKHCVLGRTLHPFCLYDALFLTITENPLWTLERAATKTDLQQAVLICSMEPERFLSATMAPRNVFERIRRWAWIAQCGRADLAAEYRAWQCYLKDHLSGPELWEEDEDEGDRAKRRSNAPWLLQLQCFVEAHSNMKEREILTAPLSTIEWKAAMISQLLDACAPEFLTDEDIEIGEEQRKAAERESAEDLP